MTGLGCLPPLESARPKLARCRAATIFFIDRRSNSCAGWASFVPAMRVRTAGEALWLLARRGLLEQRGRGMYALPDHEYTEYHSLAEAAKRVPQGTICLLSALCAHALTT